MAIEVRLAETAWRDLDEIYDWITDQSEVESARSYVDRILRKCGSLGEFPNRGARRDDLASNVRTMTFERRTLIVYSVGESEVRVIRVLHHGKDAERAFQN